MLSDLIVSGPTRSRARWLAYVLALIALAGPSAARAESYFVSPSGSPSNTGLMGSPWRQPQSALAHVGPGDVVTLEDGTYSELDCDGVSGTAAAPITFRARNRWMAHIASSSRVGGQPNVDAVNLVGCSYVVIDGLQVSGASRAGIRVGGLEPDGSDARGVVIRNNWSHHNGASTAGSNDGIFTGFALEVLIENNLVHNTGEHGIYVSNSADSPIIRFNRVYATGRNCIQINADLDEADGDDGEITGWVIEGNVMNDCNGSFALNLDGVAYGVARNNVLYAAPNSGGITLFRGDGANPSHHNVIVNNSILNPGCDNAALQLADGAHDNVAFNNILICNTAGIELVDGPAFTHDYNIVSSYDGLTAAAHEVTRTGSAATALFVSTTDLHLSATSQAANAGIATFSGKSAPTLDAENHPRPQETGFDIGAYERGSAMPVDGGVMMFPDAGTGTPDAGTGTPDAGTGTPDAGTSGDAGSSTRDASTGDGGTGMEGGGCSTSHAQRGPVWMLALAGVLALAARRRRV